MSSTRHTYHQPQPRKNKTVEKCKFCRDAKQKCEFPPEKPYPHPCKRCQLRGSFCSPPVLWTRDQKAQQLQSKISEHPDSQLLLPSCNPLGIKPPSDYVQLPAMIAPQLIQDTRIHSGEAILLLSLHALLLMAIEEMVELAVDMVKPTLRDSDREQKEDSIPVLEIALAELKHISRVVMARADAIGRGPVYNRALEALRAIENPLFSKRFTWGADSVSLNDISNVIACFSQPQCSETSLSYILQIKVMQLDQCCAKDERSKMPAFRKQFALDIESLLRQGHIDVPSTFAQSQMFTPKILLQRTAFAKQVLRDPRSDYLGRCGFQVLCDAGVPHQWQTIYAKPTQRTAGCSSSEVTQPQAIALRFEFYMSSGQQGHMNVSSPEINHTDRLGRTVLHGAARQGRIGDITTLSDIYADPHLGCLNEFSLLHIAACHGNTSLMYLLLTQRWYKHMLNRLDGLYRTPFLYAARSGHMDMIAMLTPDYDTEYLDINDFDPFQDDFHGHGALAIAARSGREDVLEYLLKLRVRRMKPGRSSKNVYTEHFLLVFAVQSADRKCVELVLKYRKWQFGDDVHKRAVAYAYANETKDRQLQSVLDDLGRIDRPNPP